MLPLPSWSHDASKASRFWMHPDLRRLLRDMKSHYEEGRLRHIAQAECALLTGTLRLSSECASLDSRRQRLEKSLRETERDLRAVKEEMKQTTYLLRGVQDQHCYFAKHAAHGSTSASGDGSKTWSYSLDALAAEESVSSAHMNAFNGLCWAAASSVPVCLQEGAVPLEVHFMHLFRSGGGMWGCRSWRGFMASHQRDENTKGRESRECNFLQIWFPLLGWDEERKLVTVPNFSSQLCQMDHEEHAEDSQSSQEKKEGRANQCSSFLEIPPLKGCCSAGCLYWHRKQLEHLKRCLGERMMLCRKRFAPSETQLCAAAQLFDAAHHNMQSSRSVSEFIGVLMEVATQIIEMGWHSVMLQQVEVDQNEIPNRAAREETKRCWDTPLLHAVPRRRSSGLFPECLRDKAEINAWETILRDAAPEKRRGRRKRVQHVGEHESSLQAAAREMFRKRPTALMWRCVLRCYAGGNSSILKRRWLAVRGWRMFPSSPHLAMLYLTYSSYQYSETLKGEKKLHWDAEKLVNHCMTATKALSRCCLNALRDNANDENTCNYVFVTLRYVAVMLAIALKRLLQRHNGVENTLQQARRLLQWVTQPGNLFLLPRAAQNYSLILAALERNGHLRGLEHLPLRNISDVLLTLREEFDVCTSNNSAAYNGGMVTLNNQLQLLNNRKKLWELHPSVQDELKSSTQLSLVRALPVPLSVGEQLLLKSSLSGEVTQAVLWMEYLSWIQKAEEEEGVTHSRRVCEGLLEEVERGACSKNQLLTLLLHWRLSLESQASSSETANSLKNETEHLERTEEGSRGDFGAPSHRCSANQNIEKEETTDKPQSYESTEKSSRAASSTVKLRRASPLKRAREEHADSDLEEEVVDDDDDEEIEFLGCGLENTASVILASNLQPEVEGRVEFLMQRMTDTRFCGDPQCVMLLLVAVFRHASFEQRLDWFVKALECAVKVLREQELQWWSILDEPSIEEQDDLLGMPHMAVLFAYQIVPAVLGCHSGLGRTAEWRRGVLDVAMRQHAVHPLLVRYE